MSHDMRVREFSAEERDAVAAGGKDEAMAVFRAAIGREGA